MHSVVGFLIPWEFSPVVLVTCTAAVLLYARGLARSRAAGERVGPWRPLAYFVGLTLVYAVLQTHIDYLSQHMFWVHRGQHLVLHHLGPFLLALSAPQAVLVRGLPAGLHRQILAPMWRHPVTQGLYGLVQHPLIAPVLFVGLIYLWLMPEIHFDAMLSAPRYKLMNWSMLLDGLLFWWLILDPRLPRGRPRLGHGARIIVLWLIMLPQIVLGAYIGLHGEVLYDVYDVCGRAWPISPLVDQQIGGLITWIPSSMMSVVAGLIVLGFWMQDRGAIEAEQPVIS
ncbi:MAG: cytochrome c oxidase assembly protein [Gammaproteobacteria bacterium]|nr:cytochrome c oxidase assembly protein [Gammaproteobacteria bacterium]